MAHKHLNLQMNLHLNLQMLESTDMDKEDWNHNMKWNGPSLEIM